MATRSIDLETPARTAPPIRPDDPIIETYRLPNGTVIERMRRDIFEKAVNSVRTRKVRSPA